MSQRWTGAAALTVSMSVVWIAFILQGSSWTGLMWVVSLALAAAIWASRHGAMSSPPISQVITGPESEPVPGSQGPLNKGDRT